MDTVLQMHSHIPQPTASAHACTAQCGAGCLCWKGTLLSHVPRVVHQDFQLLFCQSAVCLLGPHLLRGVVSSQVQDFVFVFVEFPEVFLSSFLQLVKLPLNSGSSALQRINYPPHFGIVCKLRGIDIGNN